MALTALGGAGSAGASILGGYQKSSMLRYQAGIARMNQNVMTQNAEYERNVGELKAQTSGMKSRFEGGEILAGQAASGVNVNSGSNKAVQDSQKDLAVHDQDVIRANAAKKAFGYDIEATQEGAKATMLDRGSDNAKREGFIKAGGTLLGTATSVADKWLWGKQKGIWGNDSAADEDDA